MSQPSVAYFSVNMLRLLGLVASSYQNKELQMLSAPEHTVGLWCSLSRQTIWPSQVGRDEGIELHSLEGVSVSLCRIPCKYVCPLELLAQCHSVQVVYCYSRLMIVCPEIGGVYLPGLLRRLLSWLPPHFVWPF